MSETLSDLQREYIAAVRATRVFVIPDGGCEAFIPEVVRFPDEATMRAEIRRAKLEGENRRDSATDATFNAWVKCADGRTLWEFASGEPR